MAIAEGGAKELVQDGFAYASYLVMSNELNTPKLLVCPEEPNPRRVVATSFTQPQADVPGYGIPFTNNVNVSCFVGMDAHIARPTRFLSGDANLFVNNFPAGAGILLLRTNARLAWQEGIHLQKGNILFADGSVRPLKSRKLQEVLLETATATIRLAMP